MSSGSAGTSDGTSVKQWDDLRTPSGRRQRCSRLECDALYIGAYDNIDPIPFLVLTAEEGVTRDEVLVLDPVCFSMLYGVRFDAIRQFRTQIAVFRLGFRRADGQTERKLSLRDEGIDHVPDVLLDIRVARHISVIAALVRVALAEACWVREALRLPFE